MVAPDGEAEAVTRRSRPSLVVWVYTFVASLLLVAGIAVVVGTHDVAVAPESLTGALGSVVLLGGGALLLVAAWELVRVSTDPSWPRDTRPHCRPIVLVAFLLMGLIGVYVLLGAIRRVSAQWPLVAVAGGALIVVALAGLRFFGHDARVTLPRVGTIVLGLIGTILGAWEFWYQHEYVPSRAGGAVALKAGLQLAANGPADAVVRASIEYEDTGDASVLVIGSTYTLTGARVVRCERPATAASVQGVFSGFITDPQRSRFMADEWEEQPATVLAAGKFVGDGKRLDPNVAGGRDFVFHIPRGRYQLLRLRMQLFAVPASVKLSQRALPEFTKFPGDNDVYGLWRIDDDSWLHDLTFGRGRWVVIRYELVNRPRSTRTSPDLRVTARFTEPSWSQARPSKQYIDRLFHKPEPNDSSEPFADTELPLEDVVDPAAGDYLPPACRPR